MPIITVIGAWNTGTHLLHNILVSSNCICSTTESNVEIYPVNKPIWKHNPNMNVVKNTIEDKNNIVIIMYRNIYNWIHSMLKSSYEVEFTSLDGVAKIKNKKHNINICFRNIIHLYNYYYTKYKYFIENNCNVIFFDYNKIIDKNIAFDYINKKLSHLDIKITSHDNMIKELDRPSKPHGNPVKNASHAKSTSEERKKNIISRLHNNHPKLLQFISKDIIDFYENDYDI